MGDEEGGGSGWRRRMKACLSYCCTPSWSFETMAGFVISLLLRCKFGLFRCSFLGNDPILAGTNKSNNQTSTNKYHSHNKSMQSKDMLHYLFAQQSPPTRTQTRREGDRSLVLAPFILRPLVKFHFDWWRGLWAWAYEMVDLAKDTRMGFCVSSILWSCMSMSASVASETLPICSKAIFLSLLQKNIALEMQKKCAIHIHKVFESNYSSKLPEQSPNGSLTDGRRDTRYLSISTKQNR